MAAKLLKESPGAASRKATHKLELVLKCDSIGSVEAVTAAIGQIETPDVDIAIIHSGVGSVSKSDVLLAGTGSRLIIGFQTGVMPGLERELREHNVEVRLYNVIYTLIEDIREIARSMTAPSPEEEIMGSAKVIALFGAEEHVLELHHPRVHEEQRRIVRRHERARRHDAMALRAEILEEARADLSAFHPLDFS